MEKWTGKPVHLKIKTKIHEQYGSLHYHFKVQSLRIKREVVAIFKNAFIVNIDGTSRLNLQSDSQKWHL